MLIRRWTLLVGPMASSSLHAQPLFAILCPNVKGQRTRSPLRAERTLDPLVGTPSLSVFSRLLIFPELLPSQISAPSSLIRREFQFSSESLDSPRSRQFIQASRLLVPTCGSPGAMPAPEFITVSLRRSGLRVRGEAGCWTPLFCLFSDESYYVFSKF